MMVHGFDAARAVRVIEMLGWSIDLDDKPDDQGVWHGQLVRGFERWRTNAPSPEGLIAGTYAAVMVNEGSGVKRPMP